MSSLDIVKSDSRAGRRALDRLVRRGESVLDPKTLRKAEKIVAEVRKRGDRALLDYARHLDGAEADSVAGLALAASPEDSDPASLPAGFAEALERAIVAVERYHAPQARTGYRLEEEGVELEERVTPLSRVGIYVPGGRASYPSTAVMTVVPARVAGVREIAVATPPGSYRNNAALRFTLARLGVTEIWGMGGAHAVIVGRSEIVGKPQAHLLLEQNCTVTICHSRTRDLPAITRQADILVAAVGRPEMLTAEHVRDGAVVIDG